MATRLVAQLAVHRTDHHVQALQQGVLLVELAVLQDVDLDAGEDAEALRQLVVQPGDVVELAAQPGRRQAAGHGEPR